jgi:hypothetical protein
VQQHPLFIRSSALLKEARELEAEGLRYGALQRLLEARLRISRLPGKAAPMDGALIQPRVRAAQAEFAASKSDHTLLGLYLETALFEGRAGPGATVAPGAPNGHETARAVLEDVLPLYRAALGPAAPPPPARLAEATVTLIRWPFT